MSPALNGSSAVWSFEGSNAIEICDGITFNFYTGLPHVLFGIKLILRHHSVHTLAAKTEDLGLELNF